MISIILSSRVLRLVFCLPLLAVVMFAVPSPAPAESSAERDERMAWWREAKFGMFIHWGLFAIPAGEWNGKPVDGHGEWLMNKAGIPVADYAKLAPRFNPSKFDADAWAALASEAGMKYLVITAKHHDGFAMFPSQASPFNIRDATPFKRDPMAEIAIACRKHGLKPGFYYSQSQDWSNIGGFGNNWDKSQHGSYDAYLGNVAVPQVRELLENYGPIAILWYDTPRHMSDDRVARFLPLHELQPGLIVNNRLQSMNPITGMTLGDTETPEQFIPPTGYPGKDWETCMTMNESWGFKKNDQAWKSTGDLLRKLSDITSKGGNFLLNVGPDAEGEIPAPSVDRLREIGVWMKRNGQAIYGTRAGPFPRRLPWGRTTRKGNTLFLHVWDWPRDGKLLLPGVNVLPLDAAAEMTPAGVVVALPKDITAEPDVTIVALEFPGPVATSQSLPEPGADGTLTLLPADAELTGGMIDTGVAKVMSGWSLTHCFQTPEPAMWRVTAEVSPSAYNRIKISAPGPFGRSITTAVQAWGSGPGDFITMDMGILALPAGTHALEFSSEMTDLRPLQIRQIRLSAVK